MNSAVRRVFFVAMVGIQFLDCAHAAVFVNSSPAPRPLVTFFSSQALAVRPTQRFLGSRYAPFLLHFFKTAILFGGFPGLTSAHGREEGGPDGRDFDRYRKAYESAYRKAEERFGIFEREPNPGNQFLFLESVKAVVKTAEPIAELIRTFRSEALKINPFDAAEFIAAARPADYVDSPQFRNEQDIRAEEFRHILGEMAPDAGQEVVQVTSARIRPMSSYTVAAMAIEHVLHRGIAMLSVRGTSIFDAISHYLKIPSIALFQNVPPDGFQIFIASGFSPAMTAAFAAREFVMPLLDVLNVRLPPHDKKIAETADILLGLALIRRGRLAELNSIEFEGVVQKEIYRHFYRHYIEARSSTQLNPEHHEARWAAVEGETSRRRAASMLGELHQLGYQLAEEFRDAEPDAAAVHYAYRLLRAMLVSPPGEKQAALIQAALDTVRRQTATSPEERERFDAILKGVSAAASPVVSAFAEYASNKGDETFGKLERAVKELMSAALPLREMKFGDALDPHFQSLVHGMLQAPGGDFEAIRPVVRRSMSRLLESWQPARPDEEKVEIANSVEVFGLPYYLKDLKNGTGIFAMPLTGILLRNLADALCEYRSRAGLVVRRKGEEIYLDREPIAVAPGLGPELTAALAAGSLSIQLLAQLLAGIRESDLLPKVSTAVILVTMAADGSLDTLRQASMFGLPLRVYRQWAETLERTRSLVKQYTSQGGSLTQASAALWERKPTDADAAIFDACVLAAIALETAEQSASGPSAEAASEDLGRLALRYLYYYALAPGLAQEKWAWTQDYFERELRSRPPGRAPADIIDGEMIRYVLRLEIEPQEAVFIQNAARYQEFSSLPEVELFIRTMHGVWTDRQRLGEAPNGLSVLTLPGRLYVRLPESDAFNKPRGILKNWIAPAWETAVIYLPSVAGAWIHSSARLILTALLWLPQRTLAALGLGAAAWARPIDWRAPLRDLDLNTRFMSQHPVGIFGEEKRARRMSLPERRAVSAKASLWELPVRLAIEQALRGPLAFLAFPLWAFPRALFASETIHRGRNSDMPPDQANSLALPSGAPARLLRTGA